MQGRRSGSRAPFPALSHPRGVRTSPLDAIHKLLLMRGFFHVRFSTFRQSVCKTTAFGLSERFQVANTWRNVIWDREGALYPSDIAEEPCPISVFLLRPVPMHSSRAGELK